MGFIKTCLIVLAALVVAVVLAAGASYYLLTRPSPTQAQLTPATPDPQAAQRLDEKVEALLGEVTQAGQTGQAREVRLVLTEQEVNSKIAQALTQAVMPPDLPLEISKVQVSLREGKVIAAADVIFSGMQLPLTLEARLGVEAGKPKLIVDNISVGSFPLPQTVKEQFLVAIDQGTRDLFGDLPLEVSSIQVQSGQLTLVGTARPK